MPKTLQELLSEIKLKYPSKIASDISNLDLSNLRILENLLNQEQRDELLVIINNIMKSDTLNDAEKLLHLALQNEFMKVFEFLLSNGVDINSQDSSQDTPLHLMAVSGTTAVVQFLVSKGADVNAKNHNDQTPLHCAIEYNDVEVVEIVLRGADVNAQDVNQDTPLHLAVKRLISRINSAKRKNDEIRPEVLSEIFGIIDLLFTNGADINALNNEGKTVLHLAAECQDVIVINHLLQVKDIGTIKINQKDCSGNTPLCLATKKGCPFTKVIKVLLDQGACLDMCNSDGRNAMSYINGNEQLKNFYQQYLQDNNDNVSQNSLKNEGISQQSVSSDQGNFDNVSEKSIQPAINQITIHQASQDIQRHPVTGAVVGSVIGVASFIAVKMIVTSMAFALVLASSIFPLLGIALCCAIIGGVAGYNCKSSKNITCNADLDTQEHRSLFNTSLINDNENSENPSNKENQADRQFEQSQDTQEQDQDSSINALKILQ